MQKKQTAVQELVCWLKEVDAPIGIIKKAEQALQMEREQHKETWFDSTCQFANDAVMDNKIDFETYYTQTFNQ